MHKYQKNISILTCLTNAPDTLFIIFLDFNQTSMMHGLHHSENPFSKWTTPIEFMIVQRKGGLGI
jgi:hypothetical protein